MHNLGFSCGKSGHEQVFSKPSSVWHNLQINLHQSPNVKFLVQDYTCNDMERLPEFSFSN